MKENEYLIRQGFYYKGKCEAYEAVMRSLGIIDPNPKKLFEIAKPIRREDES